MTELTSVDLSILGQLQADASRPTGEIAETAGVSQSVCWRRIQRLRDEGVITGQVAVLDRQKVGLATLIFAQVRLSAHGRTNLAEVSQAIRAFPQVLECHVLMGNYDFLLKIVTPTISDYEHFFFEKLSNLAAIQEINSIVALSEIKMTTALPLSLRH
eukprot:gene13802-17489_t